MVLKQKGKPEKGKKPVRGGPRQFSDHREFPDGPVEEFENLRVRRDEAEESSGSDGSDIESSSEGEPIVPVNNKPAASATRPSAPAASKPTAPAATTKPSTPSTPSATTKPSAELSRREREAIQKEQARQHYLKMKEKEDAARLALVRKQREEAAAQHAEALKAKEAAKRR